MAALTQPRKRLISPRSDDVERRTFTRWVNAHLKKLDVSGSAPEHVVNLYQDLRDGKIIHSLYQALTREPLNMDEGGLVFHHIINIDRVLDALKVKHNIDFCNISARDLSDGTPHLTLGFVWRLILCFQVQQVSGSNDGHANENQHTGSGRDNNSAGTAGGSQRPRLQRQNTVDLELRKELLNWCKAATQHYTGVTVTDFRRSWTDGLAFLALLHRFRPDLVSSWPPLDLGSSTREKADTAFRLAENELGALSLLDAEDLVQGIVDEKSMVTYLAMLRETLGPVPVVAEKTETAATASEDESYTEEMMETTGVPVPDADSGYPTEDVVDDIPDAVIIDDVTLPVEATDGAASCVTPTVEQPLTSAPHVSMTVLVRVPVVGAHNDEIMKPDDGEPMDKKPADNEPMGDKPDNDQSTEEQPADDEPTDEKKADGKPTDETPCNDLSMGRQPPADGEQTDEKPGNGKPMDETPADDVPTDEKPADDEPTDDIPENDQSTDERPTDGVPTDEKPDNHQSTDEMPANEESTDEKPAGGEPTDGIAADGEPKDEMPGNHQTTGEKPADGEPKDETPGNDQSTDEAPGNGKPTSQKGVRFSDCTPADMNLAKGACDDSDGGSDFFVWWPWLGLLPLVLSLSYEAVKCSGRT